jgi:nitrogen fixation protein FixH
MTERRDTMPRARRPDGWWYPWLFVAAMGLVVVVNGGLVFLALKTWSGLETEQHYLKGLAYNENLKGAEAQDRLGWRVEVAFATVTANSPRAGQLTASFRDRAGTPLGGLAVEVLLIRPTQTGFDRKAALAHQGEGLYAAPVELPLPGQWDVRVHAWRGSDAFQAVKRIQVR